MYAVGEQVSRERSSALCWGPRVLSQLLWILSLRLETALCGQNIKSWHLQDPKTAVLRDVIRFRIDAEAEAPILWPLDAKSRLIGKDPDAGKD